MKFSSGCFYYLVIMTSYCGSKTLNQTENVLIFHLIDNALWGEVDGSAIHGIFPCSMKKCEMISSDAKHGQYDQLKKKYHDRMASINHETTLTASLYNIHTWGTLTKWPHPPDQCHLKTNITIVESEESHSRFNKLFQSSFPLYDGNSTTSPFSSIQRTYFGGLKPNDFLVMKPFSRLIKGASFVASTCHRGSEGTTKRISIMQQLQSTFRVDSLGKCQHTKHIPENITLGTGQTALESLQLKQRAISHYLFYLAFENTNERGYVTEKVFDALIAGVVPVYLGSSVDCKLLMPHPKAAIFLDDFQDIPALSNYLTYLSTNESAYNEHREWRHTFDPDKQSALFQKSWPCRLCEWVSYTMSERKIKRSENGGGVSSVRGSVMKN